MGTVLLFSQCNADEFLDVESPANTDDSFVTSSVSETWKTMSWFYAEYQRTDAGGGNYNWNDPCSDVEYYPEAKSSNGYNGYMRPEMVSVDSRATQFNSLFSCLARAKRVAEVLERKGYDKSNMPNEWSQLHGECMTFYWYCYFELVRHFGDIPFGVENSVVTEYGLTSRWEILDKAIAGLQAVEAEMYVLGDGGITAERMSRTFCDQLIGECAIYAGGYQTIRLDSIAVGLYGDVQYTAKYSEPDKYAYVRRNDYKQYYQVAQTYFRKVLNENRGSLTFLTTDDRGYTCNPFQLGFQYASNLEVSPESLFEAAGLAPNQSERPYSQGRPSGGGGSKAAPCKVFGGVRIMPMFYYTGYEEGDLRADASMVVTGSDGKGNEKLISFKPGAKMDGGISTNKWDDNRMNPPYVTKQRCSGLSYVMRRISNTKLLLAEVDIELGDNAEAMTQLNDLRRRAGVSDLTSVTMDDLSKEVARELLGEGDVRWESIRNGSITDRAKKMRSELQEMRDGLKANGYYTFANGKTISNYVWTKLVERPAIDGAPSATLTYNAVDGDPVLSPGWRGLYDYSTLAEVASVVTGTAHNLAIQGLFTHIEPGSAEALALEADGYEQTPWGAALNRVDAVSNPDGNDSSDDLWDFNMMSGVTITDVPLYYHSIPKETITQSKGHVTNGYGMPQE